MRMLKLILLSLVILTFSQCTKIDRGTSDEVVLETRTWSSGTSETKSMVEMFWEETDSVSIYSVNKEGKITYIDNVVVTNVTKNGDYADIVAMVDKNALHYYGHYPAGSCPLNVGDKYSEVYKAPSLQDAPRLHDLPQIGQAHGNSIHFHAQCSCFRLYEIRKSKLPVNVKVYNENGELLQYRTITKNDADLDAHFSRKSLFHITDYYDYCWYIPDGKTYTIKVQLNPGTIVQRQYADTQVGKKGVVYNFDVWGY